MEFWLFGCEVRDIRTATNSDDTLFEKRRLQGADNVTIQNVANGQTQEMKYKKAESLLATGTWVLVS